MVSPEVRKAVFRVACEGPVLTDLCRQLGGYLLAIDEQRRELDAMERWIGALINHVGKVNVVVSDALNKAQEGGDVQ